MRSKSCIRNWLAMLLAVALGANLLAAMPAASGKDFIVVVGGGFSRESNQASLEANLVFVQEVLMDRGGADARRFFYFADGDDAYEDLQIVAPKSEPGVEHELIRFLKGVHRQDTQELAYRNHRVPMVDGQSSPENVRSCLAKIAAEATSGDRVIVYVTAHGGAGARRSRYNTTVMGWNRSSFSVSDFAKWLSVMPEDVPCVSIMAQCYCGGFADAIFDQGNVDNGVAKRLHVGFFAQQHNLPAAGCRPDIEDDEEFSSYFWGAMVGRSRTGEPFHEVDIDGDGVVSFAEAYAFTVIMSRTIDIPLRASDRLLRVYSSLGSLESKLAGSALDADVAGGEDEAGKESARDTGDEQGRGEGLVASPSGAAARKTMALRGPILGLLRDSNPTTRRIAVALMKQLDVPESADVSDVYRLQDELDSEERSSGGRGRARPRSSRRQLLTLIRARWEKLADRNQWQDHVAQLPAEECDTILRDIQSLEGYSDYKKNREESKARVENAQARELQQVTVTRLIHHLELAVLERNLPDCAPVEIQERYRKMIELENQGL